MARTPKDTLQVTLRIPRIWVEASEGLARALALSLYGRTLGGTLSRTDVIRLAISKGLDVINSELERHERLELRDCYEMLAADEREYGTESQAQHFDAAAKEAATSPAIVTRVVLAGQKEGKSKKAKK